MDEAQSMDEALDLFNDYYSGSRSVPEMIFLNLNLTPQETQVLLEPFETLKISGQQLTIMASVSCLHEIDFVKLQRKNITYFDQNCDISKAELLSGYFQLSQSPQ